MAVQHPRLSANVHLLSRKNDQVDRPLKSAKGSDDILLSQYLWDQTESLRQKIVKTYFVQGICNGTLNPTAFGGYMVQDSVYCYMVKGSIDVAAGRATQEDLKSYLLHESQRYESYYKDLWKKWHIANPNGIHLGDACKAYADYERCVASDMDTIYFIVSMIPCMKLWPWLGRQLQLEDHCVYTDWYNANFDPNYKGYDELDAFVDGAAAMGEINKEHASQVYNRCMTGEFAFFDSPKDMY